MKIMSFGSSGFWHSKVSIIAIRLCCIKAEYDFLKEFIKGEYHNSKIFDLQHSPKGGFCEFKKINLWLPATAKRFI
jgi:hypothetical protein